MTWNSPPWRRAWRTAMTTPDLRVLTAQVGEVLGAWGFALEQTRELTPVLVGTDASGAPIRDARGAVVARARRSDSSLKSVHHPVAIAA
jgi:hypothetical protein